MDVVIVGCSPAGLSAGLYQTRGKYWTLVIDKESSSGQTTKVEWIENYPSLTGLKAPFRITASYNRFFSR